MGTNREKLKSLALGKVAPIVKYLGDEKEFMCGELTYIDFCCLELFELVQFLTQDQFYQQHSSVEKYVKRMKELPTLDNYFSSSRYVERPFNNKVAKINNLP